MKSTCKNNAIVLLSRLLIKVISVCNACYEKAYLNILKNEMSFLGENAKIEMPVSILSPECISVGKSFVARKGLKLRAFTQFNGQRFNPQIIIGKNVSLETDCHIGCINKIVIGNNVLIASHVFINDHSHGRSDFSDMEIPPLIRELTSKGEIIIEDNVWIGENVVVLSDVIIGENSIIGANSVVTRSIPANCIAAGSPARVIKQLETK